MSNNERDTKFAGFAKRLMAELIGPAGYMDFTKWDTEEVAYCEGIIARRVYDLAKHLLYEAPVSEYEWDVHHASDLTEWPEE